MALNKFFRCWGEAGLLGQRNTAKIVSGGLNHDAVLKKAPIHGAHPGEKETAHPFSLKLRVNVIADIPKAMIRIEAEEIDLSHGPLPPHGQEGLTMVGLIFIIGHAATLIECPLGIDGGKEVDDAFSVKLVLIFDYGHGFPWSFCTRVWVLFWVGGPAWQAAGK
jgi:hypothetical protein